MAYLHQAVPEFCLTNYRKYQHFAPPGMTRSSTPALQASVTS
jgi:hypothetical protein